MFSGSPRQVHFDILELYIMTVAMPDGHGGSNPQPPPQDPNNPQQHSGQQAGGTQAPGTPPPTNVDSGVNANAVQLTVSKLSIVS